MKSKSSSKSAKEKSTKKEINKDHKLKQLLDQSTCKDDAKNNDKLLVNIKKSPHFDIQRVVDYKNLNTVQIIHKEWFWSPSAVVINLNGTAWISDQRNNRIWVYKLDPVLNLIKKTDEILINGSPSKMIVLKNNVVVVLTETATKMKMLLFNPQDKSIIREIILDDFVTTKEASVEPITVQDSKKKKKSPSSRSKSKESQESKKKQPEVTKGAENVVIKSKVCNITSNEALIFTVYGPLQRIESYDFERSRKIKVLLENYYKDEKNDVHLASSLEVFATKDFFYACCLESRKVLIFWIKLFMTRSIIDFVKLAMWQEIALDDLSIGYPQSIFVDDYDTILVGDSKYGALRIFQKEHWLKGPNPPSVTSQTINYLGENKVDISKIRNIGRMFVGRNGILSIVDLWNNSVDFIYDRDQFVRLDDSYFDLSYRKDLRSMFDRMMPYAGLRDLVRVEDVTAHYPCSEYVPEDLENLVSEKMKLRFSRYSKEMELEKEAKEVKSKKSRSTSSSKKNSSKKDSKKSRSKAKGGK